MTRNTHPVVTGKALDDKIEVQQVIRKPVTLRPAAVAESAPVRCNAVPWTIQFIDKKLETQSGVSPAMQEKQRFGISAAPGIDTVIDIAYGQVELLGPVLFLI